MTNLWEETIEILSEYGKTFDDVLFIQGDDFEITKDNFETVAKHANYDSGFGAQRVAKDLILVGKDWWLERGEYDGSEWWCFKTIPQKKDEIKNITRLDGGMWAGLMEINEEVE